MVYSRISTYRYHQTLLFDYGRAQNELGTLNRQISSGKIARTFEELNGKVERVNALENKLKTIRQHVESNTQAISQLQTMDRAVDDIVEISDEIKSNLTLARSATKAQYGIFAQTLRSQLETVAGLLNTNISGRYLFAGGKTNVPPVTTPVPNNFTLGVPDETYYNGDNEAMQVRANANFLLDYGVRANDPAFQALIAAVNQGIDGLKSGDVSAIGSAFEAMNDVADQLNAVKARISGNVVTLQNTNAFHDATKAYVEGVYGTETSTDVVAASSELAIQQAILQASFQAFSSISSLNLADYLR